MRTTVDIPGPIYLRLKSVAALRRCSVEDLILLGVKAELGRSETSHKKSRVGLPIIDSKRPGWLRLTNRRINEILP